MEGIAPEQGSPATLRYDINQRLNKFSLPKVDQPHTPTYKGVVESGGKKGRSRSTQNLKNELWTLVGSFIGSMLDAVYVKELTHGHQNKSAVQQSFI